jgi:hypothetical protein
MSISLFVMGFVMMVMSMSMSMSMSIPSVTVTSYVTGVMARMHPFPFHIKIWLFGGCEASWLLLLSPPIDSKAPKPFLPVSVPMDMRTSKARLLVHPH